MGHYANLDCGRTQRVSLCKTKSIMIVFYFIFYFQLLWLQQSYSCKGLTSYQWYGKRFQIRSTPTTTSCVNKTLVISASNVNHYSRIQNSELPTDILIYSNKKYNIVNVSSFIKEIFNKCLAYMLYTSEILSELDINGGTDTTFRCFHRLSSALYGSFNNGSDVLFLRPPMVGKSPISVVGLFSGFMERFTARCWRLIPELCSA